MGRTPVNVGRALWRSNGTPQRAPRLLEADDSGMGRRGHGLALKERRIGPTYSRPPKGEAGSASGSTLQEWSGMRRKTVQAMSRIIDICGLTVLSEFPDGLTSQGMGDRTRSPYFCRRRVDRDDGGLEVLAASLSAPTPTRIRQPRNRTRSTQPDGCCEQAINSPGKRSRRTPPSRARGSAARPRSAGLRAPPPRRPAGRTPVRSLRRESSGHPPPSRGP